MASNSNNNKKQHDLCKSNALILAILPPKKRRQSMIKGAAGKGFNPPVVLRMPVSQICVCLSHKSSHQWSHNATGQRTHQRLKGDPTMSRQLFR